MGVGVTPGDTAMPGMTSLKLTLFDMKILDSHLIQISIVNLFHLFIHPFINISTKIKT